MNNLTVCQLEQENSDKKHMFDLYYLSLLEAMKMRTENFKFRHKKYVPIIGCNIYCKIKYSIAQEAFLNWTYEGKIRHGGKFTIT